MMLCFRVMYLMDRNRRVYNRRLHYLLADDGLDDLVHVMMTVFSTNDGFRSRRILSFPFGSLAFVLSGFFLSLGFDGGRVTVVMLSVLNWSGVVVMFLRAYLTIRNWLNGSVVMILMYFAINKRLDFLPVYLRHMLVNDCWSNDFVDGGATKRVSAEPKDGFAYTKLCTAALVFSIVAKQEWFVERECCAKK